MMLGMASRKMRVLEDKACFFEGQVNPLHQENQVLKEQIIALNRMITGRPTLTQRAQMS
jgi:hypothetical protein